MLPAARLGAAHNFTALYNTAGVLNQAGNFAGIHPFPHAPMCALALAPLANLPIFAALATWQCLSLFLLAYSVFLIGNAASRIDAASGMENCGWLAFLFLPFVISIWSGTGDIIFGLVPLAVGYFFCMTKRYFTAGCMFALCLCKPICLLPTFVTAFGLFAHKRTRCMAGLVIGLAIILGGNAYLSWPAFIAWLRSLAPAFQVSLAVERVANVQTYVANLPQAVLLMIPEDRQLAFSSFIMLGAGALLFLALHQILRMQKGLKEDYEIAPLTFVTALFLIPLVVPGVTVTDLTVMILAAFVVTSLEWRRFSEWRLMTTLRVSTIAVNAYVALIIFQRQYAYPIILSVILMIYFRRIVEAVHLAASEHGGIEKTFAAEQEEFFD